MKKINLFTFIFFAAVINLFASEAARLELYNDNQKNSGAKINMPLMEFRISGREEKFNYGFHFSSQRLYKKLPVEIKIGNLSCGGSLSRLGSPELSSSSSPFSNGLIYTSGLTATLPGYTSFSKQESAFFQIKMNQLTKSPLSITLNAWTSPQAPETVFSTIITDKFFADRLTLNASLTGGKFFYESNDSSSWFLKTPYYPAGEHYCSLFQLSAELKSKTKKLSAFTGFTAGIYESPFGPYSAVYRTDFKLSVKETEFYTSAFLNAYEDVLTSSEKKLEPCSQFKGGIVSKKALPLPVEKANLLFIKIGANAYTRINLQKNEHPLRLNTGIQFSSDIASLSFSLSTTGKMLSASSDSSNASSAAASSSASSAASSEGLPETLVQESTLFQIKNSWYLKKITPGFTLSAEKNKNSQIKYKIQLNMTNNAKEKISGNLAFAFTTKEGAVTDKKITAAINCRFNFKMITIIGKLSTTLE